MTIKGELAQRIEEFKKRVLELAEINPQPDERKGGDS